ncbi:amino acid adenylation domain-containing protein [Arhodomonas sp. AD133]|uniref:amino acid adenylation domain-containing protein n=1 Tax=Arhodomonas sp. AD133 TaxID=3415009 RepID=UPI003EBE2DD2
MRAGPTPDAGTKDLEATATPVGGTVTEQALRLARSHSDDIALIDGQGPMTRREVIAAATAVAHRIMASPAYGAGAHVGLILPHDRRMPVAMLAAGLARVAFVPIDRAWPEARRRYVLGDAGCRIVLCAEGDTPAESDAEAVVLDDMIGRDMTGRATAWPVDVMPAPRDSAYIVYTSGSTGQPKGVEIGHAALSHLLEAVRPILYDGVPHGFREAISAPFVFDVTVQQVFSGLVDRNTLVIVSDAARRDPTVFVELIRRHRVQLVNVVASQLDLLIEAGLGTDDTPVERLVTGGEQVPIALLKRIFETPGLRDARIYNMYGPTENCVDSTCFQVTADTVSGLDYVPIGAPLQGVGAYVLDEDGVPVPDGETGELCLSGKLLAKGYFGRPELTDAAFVTGLDGTRIYRTGDLGRRRADGHLEFRGRTDDQVKIAGQRVQLSEIEHQLGGAPGVRQAAVAYRPREIGGELLGFVSGNANAETLRAWLRGRLPAHQIPHRIVHWDGPFPTTHNGKIDHDSLIAHAAPAAGSASQTDPSEDDSTRLVREIWTEVLGHPPAADARFLSEGADSIAAIRLISRLRTQGHDLDTSALMGDPTPADIAAALRPFTAGEERGSDRSTGPATHAQSRMWFSALLAPSGAYNVPLYRHLGPQFDPDRFETVVARLAARHPGLRTSFAATDDGLVQTVSAEALVAVERLNAESPTGARELADQFARPRLEAEAVPPWRLALIAAPDGWHLIWVLHHALIDGWAVMRLLDEANRLYHDLDAPLAPPGPSLIDHALAEQAAELSQSLAFWRDYLAPPPPALPYPQTGRQGAGLETTLLDADTAAAVAASARTCGVTQAAVVLGCLAAVVARATGEGDLCIGLGFANRRDAALDRVVGCFVNTMPLRLTVDERCELPGLFHEAARQIAVAADHQHCPLDEIVKNTGHAGPPFEVVLAFQNFEELEVCETPIPVSLGQSLGEFDYTLGTAQFAATLYVYRNAKGMAFQLSYDRARLSRRVAQAWLGGLVDLARAGAAGCVERLALDLPGSRSPGPPTTTDSATSVDVKFRTQALDRPDAVAVEHAGERLSYRALDETSNAIAGVLAEDLPRSSDVAVLADRSIPQMAAMLGVLRAGHCYVPLHPGLPESHLAQVMRQTGARALLYDAGYRRLAERLAWGESSTRMTLLLDRGRGAAPGPRMSGELWDQVARTATDAIAAGGWRDPADGSVLSAEVMEAYAANVRGKLAFALGPETRVLEVGCGSGLSMAAIAPHVGHYTATDLSGEMLAWCRRACDAAGWDHVICVQRAAEEAVKTGGPYDVVILNSVIQSLPSLDYLSRLLRAVTANVHDGGTIFLGHLWDPERRGMDADPHALYVARSFVTDLPGVVSGLASVELSEIDAPSENALTRTGFDAVLRVDHRRAACRAPRVREIDADTLQPPATAVHRARPDDAAYAIFTSGSTGQPKGVRIRHRALANLCSWFAGFCEMTDEDRVLSIIASSFDASLKNALTPLTRGARVVLFPEGPYDPDALAACIADSRATVLNPGTPGQVLPAIRAVARQGYAPLQSLRVLALGGEAPSPADFRDWLRSDACGLKWFGNVYGPTECADISAAHRWRPAEIADATRLPIGRPLPGVTCRVIDEHGRPVPEGGVGELEIAGIGVAAGYIDHPRQTAERFATLDGTRRYRSGDLAAVGADGLIWMRGRRDDEVKLRGQRVIPGEVERLVQREPGVLEAVAVVRDGALRLAVAGKVDPDRLRERLASKLPAAVVPSTVLLLDRLPRTAHGKIDRQAVVAAGIAPRSRSVPLSPDEATVHRAWTHVLGEVPRDPTLGFTAAGGHSLALVQVAEALRQQVGQAPPLARLVRAETLAEQAMLLGKVQEVAGIGPPCTVFGDPADPPVFAFPPISGLGLFFAELGYRLDGVALYAFDFAPSPDPVGAYAEAIVQTHAAPVTLLGMSAGGNLAFALARRLATLGSGVERLVLVDSVPRCEPINAALALDWGYRALGPLSREHSHRERLEAYVAYHAAGLEEGVLAVPIEIVLSEDMQADPSAAWRAHTRGTVRTHRVSGTHHDVLSAYRLDKNLAVLQTALGRS